MREPPSSDVTTIPVLRTIARGCREAFRHGLVYTVYAVAWAIIADGQQGPTYVAFD